MLHAYFYFYFFIFDLKHTALTIHPFDFFAFH
jgi:hypothetical protein